MTYEQAKSEYATAVQKAHKHHSAIAPCDEYCSIASQEAKVAFESAKEST
jgi:hypothetical protein